MRIWIQKTKKNCGSGSTALGLTQLVFLGHGPDLLCIYCLGANSSAREAEQAEGYSADTEGSGDHADEGQAVQRGEVDQVQSGSPLFT